jgi:hypothetical protein
MQPAQDQIFSFSCLNWIGWPLKVDLTGLQEDHLIGLQEDHLFGLQEIDLIGLQEIDLIGLQKVLQMADLSSFVCLILTGLP